MTQLPARAPRKLVIPATTLREAWYVLDPVPLDFGTQPDVARHLYIPHAARLDKETGMAVTSPSKELTMELLNSTFEMKAFLSGHVGSGKSTELRKVAANTDINAAFFPIMLEIEAGYSDVLDILQLQFLMACAVYDYAKEKGLLNHRDFWKEPFRALFDSFIQPNEGTTTVEFDFVFVKLKQDLKYGEYKRSQLRDLDKSRPSLLKDLVTGLVTDMQLSAAEKGEGREPVLFIDDLDKVRAAKAQEETFRAKPVMLFDPPLRVVYTVPTGVAFHDCPETIQSRLLHLYPAPALKKAPGCYNPEETEVVNDVGIHFLQTVFETRVGPNLFTPAAIRLAAIYSGGLLRNFFRLLRMAVDVAENNDRTIVDENVLRAAIKSARLNLSMSLHKKQYDTLAEVHRTNFLADGDSKYLDQSWVVECFNDKVWYEANPLVWKLLDPDHK
jgi:hypothetical protein